MRPRSMSASEAAAPAGLAAVAASVRDRLQSQSRTDVNTAPTLQVSAPVLISHSRSASLDIMRLHTAPSVRSVRRVPAAKASAPVVHKTPPLQPTSPFRNPRRPPVPPFLPEYLPTFGSGEIATEGAASRQQPCIQLQPAPKVRRKKTQHRSARRPSSPLPVGSVRKRRTSEMETLYPKDAFAQALENYPAARDLSPSISEFDIAAQTRAAKANPSLEGFIRPFPVSLSATASSVLSWKCPDGHSIGRGTVPAGRLLDGDIVACHDRRRVRRRSPRPRAQPCSARHCPSPSSTDTTT